MTNFDREFRLAGYPQLRHISSMSKGFGQLELADDVLAATREKITHAETLASEITRREGRRAEITESLAADLSTGHVDVDEAIDALSAVQSQNAAATAIRAMLETASRLAERHAIESLRTIGDDLIAALDSEARDIASEAENLAPAVDGVADSDAAMKSGPAAAGAWARLAALAARLAAVRDLADDLRSYRIATIESVTVKDTVSARDKRSAVEVDTVIYPVADELHFEHGGPVTQAANDVKQLIADLPHRPRERTFSEWAAGYTTDATAA